MGYIQAANFDSSAFSYFEQILMKKLPISAFFAEKHILPPPM